MNEIPTWLVALSTLITAIATLTTRKRVDIRIYSLALTVQFFIYVFFTFVAIPFDTKQFIGRSDIILMSWTLTIIVLSARRNQHGN